MRQEKVDPRSPDRAREDIASLMAGLLADMPEPTVTLQWLLVRLGTNGMLVLAVPLTLVFMVPVSIPGVSTVFGAALLMIGLCASFGRPVALPAKLVRRALPAAKLRSSISVGLKWLARVQAVSRPGRMGRVASGPVATRLNNLALAFGAVLLMAPFGFIPFSNTLPAAAILFLAVGQLQRDGAAVLAGHVANVATVVYFSTLIGGGGAVVYSLLGRVAS